MNPISLIGKIFSFFSVYSDPFEKRVDLYLRRVHRGSRQDLLALIQEDLVRLTIFLEYRFKGYRKLKKSYRSKLYEKAGLIAENFIDFFDSNKARLREQQKELNISGILKQDERFTFILGIMSYLRPGERITYKASATFEKLLRNPSEEKMVGDCNQITTLYIFLYSLKYEVTDLRVKILPDHVCLHYGGVDIETTSASLASYDDYTFLSGVEEIVATNLLDVSDPSEKQFDINPKNMLSSAQLAYHFSGHRATVEKNLFIAYHNLAVYYAKQKNFSKARLFASKSANTQLQKDVARMEAVNHLKAKRYKKALECFRSVGDLEGEKACYQNELADLFEVLKRLKTVSDYKSKKPTLRRAKELALRVNNQQVVDFVNEVMKKLS